MIFTKLLFVLASLLYHSWTSTVQSAIDRELARIRAAGEPTTYAELAASYKLPAGEVDASKEWSAVVDYFKTDEFHDDSREMPLFNLERSLPEPDEEWSELVKVKAFLGTHSEGMRLIELAAKKKGAVRWPTRFEDGNDAQLPHPMPLSYAARLNSLRIHVLVREKEFDEASRALFNGFSIARALEQEPIMVCHVPRLATLEKQVQSIVQLLSAHEIPDETLAVWQQQLREIDARKTIRRTFLGERVTAIQSFADSSAFPPKDYPPEIYGRAIFRHPIQLLCYLYTSRSAMEAIDKTFPSTLHVLRAIDEWKDERDVSAYEYFRRTYARKAIRPFGTFSYGIASTAARLRAADALVAAVRYQRKHRKWPANLSEVVPDFLPAAPLDPFRDEPLTYALDDKRLLIYGFGYNQKDDRGMIAGEVKKDDGVVLDLSRYSKGKATVDR